MRWSLRIGRLAGIDVHIHATFLILLAWVGWVHWQQFGTEQAVVAGIGFILLLFACVVLHELGHALMARRFGIPTRDITLLPIGGVARLERMPDDPRQELWVALAGPAVNVLIAAGLFVWLLVTQSLEPLARLGVVSGPLAERLLAVNLFLVGFNLLPAFPMDGGRVLRAVLALRLGHLRGTRIAASIGQGMALLFGLVGLATNPFLLFIAFFVWIGAAQEAQATQMRSALRGVPVRQAMLTDYRALAPEDGLEAAVEAILAGSQQDFPVVSDGAVVGILTRGRLLAALGAGRRDERVGDVMETDFAALDDHDLLMQASEALQRCRCTTLPVVRSGRLVGLLTTENLGEFLMIREALEKSGDAAAPPRTVLLQPRERV
jgi:Zn-dependent protease/CBS domain-containing protein